MARVVLLRVVRVKAMRHVCRHEERVAQDSLVQVDAGVTGGGAESEREMQRVKTRQTVAGLAVGAV